MYLSQYNPIKQYKLHIKLSDKLVVLLAEPISHTSTQYRDVFNMPLDLSTINFAHFSGCGASFVYSCGSILECYNLFFWSQVEYKIILFYFYISSCQTLSDCTKSGSYLCASILLNTDYSFESISTVKETKSQLTILHL